MNESDFLILYKAKKADQKASNADRLQPACLFEGKSDRGGVTGTMVAQLSSSFLLNIVTEFAAIISVGMRFT